MTCCLLSVAAFARRGLLGTSADGPQTCWGEDGKSPCQHFAGHCLAASTCGTMFTMPWCRNLGPQAAHPWLAFCLWPCRACICLFGWLLPGGALSDDLLPSFSCGFRSSWAPWYLRRWTSNLLGRGWKKSLPALCRALFGCVNIYIYIYKQLLLYICTFIFFPKCTCSDLSFLTAAARATAQPAEVFCGFSEHSTKCLADQPRKGGSAGCFR